MTFDTIKTLPNMPGSVINPFDGKAGGRTYPLEGTAVLFPQHAPYTDPLTVLVCGGSNFGLAIDNCVSIQPEVDGADWVLERMVKPLPIRSCLKCVLTLRSFSHRLVS